MILECYARRPQIAPIVGSLPANPERQAVTERYEKAFDALQSSRHRLAVISNRQKELSAEFAVATAQRQRDALLAEETALSAEISLLPGVIRVQAESFAEVLLRWYTITKFDLTTAHNAVVDQLAELYGQRRPFQMVLRRSDESTRMKEHLADQAEIARTELEKTTSRMQELQVRQGQLDQAISFVDIAISSAFGEQGRSPGPRDGDVARFVKHVTQLRPAA